MATPSSFGEWERAADPASLLGCYRGPRWSSPLRLFAAGCCRRIWELVPPGPGGREAVEVAERFALGRAGRDEIRAAASEGARLVDLVQRRAAEGLFGGLALRAGGSIEDCAASAAWACTFSGLHPARVAARLAAEAVHLRRYREANGGRTRQEVWSAKAEARGAEAADAERSWQAAALRAVAGNPSRAAAPDPRWLTPDVRRVAGAIRERRAFDQLPILGDALRDGGCEDDQVLAACAAVAPDIPGCWVLDFLLGEPEAAR